MSRKPFVLMSRQGQLKRIKREMAQNTQTNNISTNDSHTEENILFSHHNSRQVVQLMAENEFDLNSPGSS